MSKAALILVDVQTDFLPPDGSLAVPNGRDVLPILHQLLNREQWDWQVVIASQDYHPEGHISFASTHDEEHFTNKNLINAHGIEYEQTLWPDHCVIGTKGAEIDKELRQAFPQWDDRMKLVRKGQYSRMEQYSVLEGELNDIHDPKDEPPKGDGSHLPKDTHVQHREVAKYLRDEGVERVVVVGLATDFCVLYTAEAALQAKFKTCVVAPAVRGIKEDGVVKAFEQIRSGGGTIIGEDDDRDWNEEIRSWLE